jgi:hypothetical protein
MWRLLFDGAPADRVPGTGGAERWTSTEGRWAGEGDRRGPARGQQNSVVSAVLLARGQGVFHEGPAETSTSGYVEVRECAWWLSLSYCSHSVYCHFDIYSNCQFMSLSTASLSANHSFRSSSAVWPDQIKVVIKSNRPYSYNRKWTHRPRPQIMYMGARVCGIEQMYDLTGPWLAPSARGRCVTPSGRLGRTLMGAALLR